MSAEQQRIKEVMERDPRAAQYLMRNAKRIHIKEEFPRRSDEAVCAYKEERARLMEYRFD